MTDIPADALWETWESIYDKTMQLADRIEKHCQASGEQFDAILVVPRGSYYPVNIVARELGFGATDLLHACLTSYVSNGIERNKDGFKFGQMPTKEQVSGKDILIIEEVCDKGFTLNYLTEWLKEQGAGLVRTGVLHYKPGQSETGFKPDWYIGETDEWIVYPWEPHEAKGMNSQVRRSAK
jgi:hypoxanthine phosphoribosyltransferase